MIMEKEEEEEEGFENSESRIQNPDFDFKNEIQNYNENHFESHLLNSEF
jgi:hypothetical protein